MLWKTVRSTAPQRIEILIFTILTSQRLKIRPENTWVVLLVGGFGVRADREDPIIRAGVVIAVANTITSGACSGGGGSYVYAFDACSGGRPERPMFDINGDGVFDENDTVTVNGQEVYPTAQKFNTFLFDPVAMGASSI